MKKLLQKFSKHWSAKIALAIFVIAAVGVSGYILGTFRPQRVLVKSVVNIENDPKATADFGVFWEAWSRIKEEALKGPDLKEQAMVYGAIDGLVKSLEDPNSVFFPPEDAKKFEEDVAGSFGGIGAEIGIRDEQLIIVAPLKDSPAEKAGLRSLDKILKINGEETIDIKVNDAVKKIRGEIGTKVTLNVYRKDWEKPKDFEITRDVIKVPTLDWKMLDGNVGYIRLRNFNENAEPMFFRASKELLQQGLNGLVVDLRDDPGGFLDVAVNLAGWFLDKGTLVVTEEFRDRKQEFRAYGNGVYKSIPIVALINSGSASASEILAGALRDHLNATLVGEKSFGKGSVQELKRLKDGSSMKLTIAQWRMPKGDIIEKNGIIPTHEVKMSDEDIKAGKDPQLEKAKEVMKEMIEKAMKAVAKQ